MDADKQGSERSGSMSPDSIGSEKRPEELFEPQIQTFFAGERVVPESPTMDMPSFIPPTVQNQAKEHTRSITLQPTYGEPITVSEKQPSVEVVEFSSITAPSDFSSMGVRVQGGDSARDVGDKSGMSAYFETSAWRSTNLHSARLRLKVIMNLAQPERRRIRLFNKLITAHWPRFPTNQTRRRVQQKTLGSSQSQTEVTNAGSHQVN